MAHEAVIGLECHVQLRTRTKMFCECPAAFGAEPNSNVCPVCLGLPGALPRANRAAVLGTVRLGLALGCRVHRESVFARKHYFYPDSPKNYQITQYDRPLCEGGALPLRHGDGGRGVELLRIHVEEDTGKSFHPQRGGLGAVSRLDFNRAGVPLLELVTKPVLRDPAECADFLTALRRLVRWLGISDGDMEKGQLRCDANVSLRPAGTDGLGVKTELKNLNSIRGVERGLAAEIARQRDALERGGVPEQATLLYDAERDRLVVMRSKESAHDYRYLDDPDLPVLRLDRAALESARAGLPELPWIRAARLARDHGLPAHDADVLCEQSGLADYYEACAAAADARLSSHWIMIEVLHVLRDRDWTIADFAGRVTADRLAALLRKLSAQELPRPLARQAFAWMLDEEGDAAAVLTRHGVTFAGSPEEVRAFVLQVIEEHPGPVGQVLAGRTRTLDFLVGQVMKRSGGRAAPEQVRELLREELRGRGEPGA
jgi:aspartyl-tRNA(Asn)/glutamyl-tRNA(Gln) amidotransferase subunit B